MLPSSCYSLFIESFPRVKPGRVDFLWEKARFYALLWASVCSWVFDCVHFLLNMDWGADISEDFDCRLAGLFSVSAWLVLFCNFIWTWCFCLLYVACCFICTSGPLSLHPLLFLISSLFSSGKKKIYISCLSLFLWIYVAPRDGVTDSIHVI